MKHTDYIFIIPFAVLAVLFVVGILTSDSDHDDFDPR